LRHSLEIDFSDREKAARDADFFNALLAKQHLDFLDRKLEELQSMKHALAHLVSCCHGDERPDCPILDGLAGKGS